MFHVPCSIITNSEKETLKFAEKFSKSLKGGEVLCLVGDLGSGKTVFTKGLAAGLDIKKIITSPTFVLMKVYPVESNRAENLIGVSIKKQKNKDNSSLPPPSLPLIKGEELSPSDYVSEIKSFVHIDAYRLNSGKELAAIGALDYFGDKKTVVAIEWADRVKDIWPEKNIVINFTIRNKNQREITIKNI